MNILTQILTYFGYPPPPPQQKKKKKDLASTSKIGLTLLYDDINFTIGWH